MDVGADGTHCAEGVRGGSSGRRSGMQPTFGISRTGLVTPVLKPNAAIYATEGATELPSADVVLG